MRILSVILVTLAISGCEDRRTTAMEQQAYAADRVVKEARKASDAMERMGTALEKMAASMERIERMMEALEPKERSLWAR